MIPPDINAQISAGLKPFNAIDLNQQLGTMFRAFIHSKNSVNQWRDWLAGTDLKATPYNFSGSDEALIKSAVNDLDTSLDAINMTFVNQLAGPF